MQSLKTTRRPELTPLCLTWFHISCQRLKKLLVGFNFQKKEASHIMQAPQTSPRPQLLQLSHLAGNNQQIRGHRRQHLAILTLTYKRLNYPLLLRQITAHWAKSTIKSKRNHPRNQLSMAREMLTYLRKLLKLRQTSSTRSLQALEVFKIRVVTLFLQVST